MKVIIFGATGMVGSGVLLECLADPRVDAVLTVGRSRVPIQHPKLRELMRADFFNYDDVRAELTGYDACFFCLGVSSTGMSEAEYRRVSLDLTVAVAETLAAVNPGSTFCFVSGEGADSTEKGRIMWARVKGRAENLLLRMPLEVFVFRPGFIQPLKGVRSKTALYQGFYSLTTPLFPLLRRLFARHITTTVNMGRAMINAAGKGYTKRILENPDINQLAGDSAGL
jgi:uncharacterized protein YbjT (DUF2867 family)